MERLNGRLAAIKPCTAFVFIVGWDSGYKVSLETLPANQELTCSRIREERKQVQRQSDRL